MVRVTDSPRRALATAALALAFAMFTVALFVRSCSHLVGDISAWTYAQVRASMESKP